MNWPDYMIEATKARTSPPNPERMSVTQLTDSPLIRTLILEHWSEIENEPEDMIWALFGTALDEIVKRHCRGGLTNMLFELPTKTGLTLVGKPDIYYPSTGLLADLKTTSVWKLKSADHNEWLYQLNIYDYLMHRLFPDNKVTKLEIHGLAKDWRKGEKLRYGSDYPNCPFVIHNIKRLTHKEQEDLIAKHLKDHIENPTRCCTPEERWESPAKYAVKVPNRKSALRVLDSQKEAEKWIEDNSSKIKGTPDIEERPGGCTRCNQYCSVNKWCPYFKNFKVEEQ